MSSVGKTQDTVIDKTKFKLYQKYSEQYLQEIQRLANWNKCLPVGQYPPSFQKALYELSLYKKRKLMPLWKQIRTLIVNDGKTLWQCCAWATDDEPPLFSDIKPLLEVSV